MSPKTEWAKIETEPATTGSLFTGYAIILAAIPPVAALIGFSVIGIGVMGGHLQIPFGDVLPWVIAQYVASLAAVYGTALAIDALAPSFGAQKNAIQAMKLAVYSFTAVWVAGIFNIIPSLGVIAYLGGLYSLLLMFIGLPMLMKPPADKAPGYAGAAAVIALVIYLVLATIAARAVGFGGWGWGSPIPH